MSRQVVVLADVVSCLLYQAFVPPLAEELLARDFDRLGRLPYKAGLSLQRAQEGWFSLTGSELHTIFPEGSCEEPLHLRKLQELCAWTQTWSPNLQGTLSWTPNPPAPPRKSEYYHGLARSSQPALSTFSPALGMHLNNPMCWWVDPRDVCTQRGSGRNRSGTMNKAWASLQPLHSRPRRQREPGASAGGAKEVSPGLRGSEKPMAV